MKNKSNDQIALNLVTKFDGLAVLFNCVDNDTFKAVLADAFVLCYLEGQHNLVCKERQCQVGQRVLH